MGIQFSDTLPLGEQPLSILSFPHALTQSWRWSYLVQALCYAPHAGEHCFDTEMAGPELSWKPQWVPLSL